MVDLGIFKDVSVLSLKNRVYELLLDIIVSGKLKEGELLPPERVLCKELKVSRTVLREVVRALEARGLVTAVQGSGTTINPVNSWDMAQAFRIFSKRQTDVIALNELYDLRVLLEPEMASVAILKASEEDIIKLGLISKDLKDSKNDLNTLFNNDMDFHLHIARMSKNIYFIAIIEALITPSRKCLSTIKNVDQDRIIKEHMQIFEFIKNRDSENVKKAIINSLCYSKELFRNTINL